MTKPKYLEIPLPINHKICYYEWGDKNNEKILLCVHGLTRNGSDFEILAKKLTSKYRVISIDIVGRGNSDYLSDPSLYNYQTYFNDLSFFIEALKLTKFDYLGTSMGGILGLMLSTTYPSLIEKLILNDIGIFIPKIGLERIVKSLNNHHFFDSEITAKLALKEKLSSFSKMSDEEFEFIYSISITKNNNKFYYKYDPNIAVSLNIEIVDVDLAHLWSIIPEIKILLIRGENSDILPESIASKMAENKLLTLEIVKNCGHAPMLLNDLETNLIIDWLK